MASEAALATAALLLVTASFPFYVYGAWVIVDAEVVTWGVLLRHLKFILTGLAMNTTPVVLWMIPRLLDQLSGITAFHAFFGLQAYALLAFGLTGIVRIVQAKRRHDLYSNPEQDVTLSDVHENADAWRKRLRIGVFGYVACWIVAYLAGVSWYAIKYL